MQNSNNVTRIQNLQSCSRQVVWQTLNLDPKINIKYGDTKHQLADILTKGNFTRDEWNNLLHWFDISLFSLICCAQNSSSTSCHETMAKRMQEKKGEERIVAKSKPTLNLASHAAIRSSTVQSPFASKCPRILWAPCHPDLKSAGRLAAREHIRDAASSSQVWQKRCNFGRDCEESRPGTQGPGTREFPWEPREYEETRRFRKLRFFDGHGKFWPHSLQISVAHVPYLEKVFSNVRRRYGLKSGDKMENLDVNAARGEAEHCCGTTWAARSIRSPRSTWAASGTKSGKSEEVLAAQGGNGKSRPKR